MHSCLFLALAVVLGCPKPERTTPPGPPESSAERGADATASRDDRFAERSSLVSHLREQGIRSERVLAAIEKVPRHEFVPEAARDSAYANRPLPIGHGQTISQPAVVAAMTEAADPRPTDRCLEIGTGSGYQAAVLAELCQSVYSIEYIEALALFAESNLRRLGYDRGRVALRTGDGYLGWPEAAPFDVVLVTAAPDHVPQPLLDQLAQGGRLVIPVGPTQGVQRLELWVRQRAGSDAGAFERKTLMPVRFVPLVGDHPR
jgi:protein-L-isoaspartate(D-aspartate) O-methyltransferase